MDHALENIYECLQLSEEKFLKKKAYLRFIKDERLREEKKQNLLQTEINNFEREIKHFEEEVYTLVAKKDLQNFTHDVMEKKISTCDEVCREKNKLMSEQARNVNRQVENFIGDILDFHDTVRLDNDVLISPVKTPTNKDSQRFNEEDAVRCDLQIRKDLLKECNALGEELQQLTLEIAEVEAEGKKANEAILEEIKEAIKLRNEISEPKRVPSIQLLEKTIEEVEQETEFLTAACLALEKEKETPKSSNTRPQTTRRFTFKSKSQLSTPQVFKRDPPAKTPNKYNFKSSK